MWAFWIVFLIELLSFYSESANIREPKIGNWICKDRPHGDQIPNPEDCHSYFVCDRGWPKLVTCDGDLYYDSRQRVCNWPDIAECKLGNYPPNWNSSPKSIINTIYPKLENDSALNFKTTKFKNLPSTELVLKNTTAAFPTTSECFSSPHLPTTTVKYVNSVIGSTDESGKKVDPMKNYDPKKVQCLYNGVYFLPHPGDCQKYFICASHVLYLHSCGVFSSWNYKTERCECKEYGLCYSLDEKTFKSTTRRKRITPKMQSKKIIKNITAELYSTPTLFSSSIKSNLPECPTKEQQFVAHPYDCTKYYICIFGKPALTKCPEGLWWDEQEEWCGLPELSYCKVANKNLV